MDTVKRQGKAKGDASKHCYYIYGVYNKGNHKLKFITHTSTIHFDMYAAVNFEQACRKCSAIDRQSRGDAVSRDDLLVPLLIARTSRRRTGFAISIDSDDELRLDARSDIVISTGGIPIDQSKKEHGDDENRNIVHLGTVRIVSSALEKLDTSTITKR